MRCPAAGRPRRPRSASPAPGRSASPRGGPLACPLACLLAAAAAGCASGADPAGDGDCAPGRRARAIVSGEATAGDPAVVAIGARRVGCGDALVARCSGALVAPAVVLTAAHCVLDPRLGDALEVMIGPDVAAPEAFFRVVEVAVHPEYLRDGDPADVAVLVLDRAASPAPLPLSAQPLDDAAIGQAVRVVGFGQASAADGVTGTKRAGTARITAADGETFRIEADPAMTCRGDSGGPVLAAPPGDPGGEVIVGVTSRGDPGCAAFGLNVPVDRHLGFLEPYLAAAPDEMGGGPASVAADQLCTAACASDAECPAGLQCRPTPGDGGVVDRCVVPGLLAGDLGAPCTADDACGERCVRLRPDDGPEACRCFRACDPAPGPEMDSGCRIGVGAHGGFGLWCFALLMMGGRAIVRRIRPRSRT